MSCSAEYGVALVWITNPLTWVPLYYIAYQVGALALGALAATSPSYAAPVYGGCTIERRPVTNAWGDVIGFRRIRVCY